MGQTSSRSHQINVFKGLDNHCNSIIFIAIGNTSVIDTYILNGQKVFTGQPHQHPLFRTLAAAYKYMI